MAGKEYPQIGSKIKRLERGSPDITEVKLTDNYWLNLQPHPDFRCDWVDVHTIKDRPGMIAVQTYVKYDAKGNFTGLLRIGRGDTISALRAWKRIGSTRMVMADYNFGDEDHSAANVVNLTLLANEREHGYIPIKILDVESNEFRESGLPSVIDVPATVHRLVFGKDFDTNQKLTEKMLEAQPLVALQAA